jgi:hypothetical protein
MTLTVPEREFGTYTIGIARAASGASSLAPVRAYMFTVFPRLYSEEGWVTVIPDLLSLPHPINPAMKSGTRKAFTICCWMTPR